MPIDVIVPESTLSAAARPTLAAELTAALLHWTDATEEPDIRANVGVYIHELAPDCVNAAGRPARVARVDVKVPPVALSTQPRRTGFITDVTALVRAAALAGRPYEHVWINIVHAVDGGWGTDGVALVTEAAST